MTNFLITGGAGFVGSNLADKLSENPDNMVTVVDDLSTGSINNVPKKKNIIFIKSDVNTYKEMANVFESSFDYVFHYAAVVGVERTLLNPISVLEDIEGFRNILDLSKDNNVKRVFFASSSEVYGEPVVMPQHEDTTPLNSRLPYSVVKNIGECFLKSYKQEYDLDFTIFRFFNTYGPKQSTDFVMSKFLELAQNNKDITVYGKGDQSRTFCYISDNIDTAINCLTDESTTNQVINIGNDIETSILELAELIIKLTGSASKIVFLPPLEEGDMTRRQPDITSMKKVLSREMVNLEEGINRLMQNSTEQR
jgi:UDP-glucuronate decarboxylase